MERRSVALLIVGVTAVSFSAVLVREADAPSMAIAFYRCGLASVVLIPLGLARHREEYRRLSKRQWRLALASGVVLSAHFATWISSLSFTTVAASAPAGRRGGGARRRRSPGLPGRLGRVCRAGAWAFLGSSAFSLVGVGYNS